MNLAQRTRLSLVEYGLPTSLSSLESATPDVNQPSVKELLRGAGDRVRQSLRLPEAPFLFEDGAVRATRVAGMLRLAPGLELEIVPKFIGDPAHTAWRQDFLYLAELSRHGRLLPTERLVSSGGEEKSLAGLTARAMAVMYQDNQRRPLRAYRRSRERSFTIEGDPDPMDLVLPGADGFEQEVIRFDRQTDHNADILAALKLLSPEVSNPQTAGQLLRIIAALSPQRPSGRRRHAAVPNRSRAWQPVVDLARDILDGLGASYRQGGVRSPGYIVDSWRVWEDFITCACRIGYGTDNVLSQRSGTLGELKSASNEWLAADVQVRPDIQIRSAGITKYLVDAKYKGRGEGAKMTIHDADVYESLAFMEATKLGLVFLVYPAAHGKGALGSTEIFAQVTVGPRKIIAVTVQSQGVSKRFGLQEFSSEFAKQLEQHTYVLAKPK